MPFAEPDKATTGIEPVDSPSRLDFVLLPVPIWGPEWVEHS